MDIAAVTGSVLAAFGLSGAAGLNAWIPLLATGILQRSGAIHLDEPFDVLGENTALAVMGVCFVLDFIGDKIPAIDHALHLVGTVIAPVSGAVVFAGQTESVNDVAVVASLIAGALVAEGVHAGRATVRPVSTAGTAGAGNPLLSFAEDVVSLLLTAIAFIAPFVAFVIVVAMLVAMGFSGRALWRRLRRAREARAARAPAG
jgi:Domain of unknown function (DUF4126)